MSSGNSPTARSPSARPAAVWLLAICVVLWLGIAWLGESTTLPREPPPEPVIPVPAPIQSLTEEIRREVRILAARTAAVGPREDGQRNPFDFAQQREDEQTAAPAQTPPPVIAPAALPPTRADIRLVGLASRQSDAAHIAVLTDGADGLWLVKAGEWIDDEFRVIEVSAVGVVLQHARTGDLLRLVLEDGSSSDCNSERLD